MSVPSVTGLLRHRNPDAFEMKALADWLYSFVNEGLQHSLWWLFAALIESCIL
jgi:hypothetical protein